MAIVTFTPSVTIYKIFKSHIKRQQFDLENEGQVQLGQKEKNQACIIQLRMFDFMLIFF